jgi:hypothetical protein
MRKDMPKTATLERNYSLVLGVVVKKNSPLWISRNFIWPSMVKENDTSVLGLAVRESLLGRRG